MAETSSRVYDLTYPSPVTLKEISAIAVVAELWREEIAHTDIQTAWNELDLANDILLKKNLKIPNVPSTVYNVLVKYIVKFISSFGYRPVVLDTHFHDYVWDWNGAVHNVQTAKRMLLCDQLTADEKFSIACKYCLEDDIRRLWPRVSSSNFDITHMDFHSTPLLYYWICCIRNELHNIPNPDDKPIDERMFYSCEIRHEGFSSLEYFWNRISYERRSYATIMMFRYDPSSFARFILPRLDDFQLETFLAEEGVNFMSSLLTGNIRTIVRLDRIPVLPTWIYIRNKISRSQFIELIEKSLAEETNIFTDNSNDDVHACCEVWKNSPDNFKQWALDEILLNEQLFNRMSTGPHNRRQMRFLITVLLDASFEQKQLFWCKNWRNLITGARVEDLQVVMKLCFCDENGISSFKEQYMSKYENIGPYCVKALKAGCFEGLSEFLYFCYSDKQKARELKQQLLRSNFLGENSILCCDIIHSYHKQLNAFIEDAFEDADLCAQFKNQFVSSPATKECLLTCIRFDDFGCVKKLVETFVTEELPCTEWW